MIKNPSHFTIIKVFFDRKRMGGLIASVIRLLKIKKPDGQSSEGLIQKQTLALRSLTGLCALTTYKKYDKIFYWVKVLFAP